MIDFRRGLKVSNELKFEPISFINIAFLVSVFYLLSFYFTRPSSISMRLPAAVTSDIVQDKITIVITSENILYYDGRVTTLKELREVMSRPENKKRPVFIKADRQASVGRIADVWGLGRSLGLPRIDVATD